MIVHVLHILPQMSQKRQTLQLKCIKIKSSTSPNAAHFSERYKWTRKWAGTSSLPGVSLKIFEVLQKLHLLSLWYKLYRAFFSATSSSGKFLCCFLFFFTPQSLLFLVVSKVRRLQEHILGHCKMGETCKSSNQSYSFLPLATTYIHGKHKGQEGEGEKSTWRGCYMLKQQTVYLLTKVKRH